MIMSECLVRACDLSALGSASSPGGKFGQTRVTALRERAQKTPLPLSANALSALSQHDVWKAPTPDMPEWARGICRHRDHFKGVVLLVRENAATISYWKVIYAVQQP